MLSPYRGPKSRQSLEGAQHEFDGDTSPITVLPSSTELFYFYAQTLEQCAKYTKGEGMRELVGVFGKWLQIYSGEWSRGAGDGMGERGADVGGADDWGGR